jgi:hypothetical protein
MTPQQEEWIKEKTKEIGRLWFSEVRLRSAIEAALRAAIEQQQGKEDETPQPTGNFIVDLAKWAALLTKKNEQLSAAEAKIDKLGQKYWKEVYRNSVLQKWYNSRRRAAEAKVKELTEKVEELTMDNMTHEYNQAEAERTWPQFLEQIEEPLKNRIAELEAQLIDIDNLRMSADRRVAELEGKRAKPLKVDHPNGKDYGSLFRLQEAIRQLPEHGNQLHGLLCDFLDELEGKERQYPREITEFKVSDASKFNSSNQKEKE